MSTTTDGHPMNADEPITLTDVRRLVIAPGETLLFTLPADTTPSVMRRIAEAVRAEVPNGVHVLVVTDNVRVDVVAREDESRGG